MNTKDSGGPKGEPPDRKDDAMRQSTPLGGFTEQEFVDLCSAIIKDFVAEAGGQLDNPLAFVNAGPCVVRATQERVQFERINGGHIAYNILTGSSAHVVAPRYVYLYLFHAHHFSETPPPTDKSLALLQSTVLSGLEQVLRLIEARHGHDRFDGCNHVFLCNLDVELAEIDYPAWIADHLSRRYPWVEFQIGTSFSILGRLNNPSPVREKYLSILNSRASRCS
jgi:hypothetical protein